MIKFKKLIREFTSFSRYRSQVDNNFIAYAKSAKKKKITKDKSFDAASDFIAYMKRINEKGDIKKFETWLNKRLKMYL